MVNSRKYPWPEPASVYDGAGPSSSIDFEQDGVRLRVAPTNEVGISTGRTRYRVECLTCDTIVHSATTGPGRLLDHHLDDAHKPASAAERKSEPLSVIDDWLQEVENTKRMVAEAELMDLTGAARVAEAVAEIANVPAGASAWLREAAQEKLTRCEAVATAAKAARSRWLCWLADCHRTYAQEVAAARKDGKAS